MAYNQAEQFLNNSSKRPGGLNIDAGSYINKNNQAIGNYQSQAQGSLDTYKGQMGQNIDMMKDSIRTQMNALNQQLNNNRLKYEMMADEQRGSINKNYKKQNEQIDQMTFNQYKMANQMGAQRGVSSSAQQMAMDNHVGQTSASLFNENSTNRQDSLNTLQNKLMQGYIDLDNQYSKDSTGIYTNGLNQMMQHNSTMAGKEFEFASNMANKVLEMQLKNNEIEFKTEAEKEKYKAELEKMIYQMQFQNYGAMDNRNFQADESAKNRANQLAMQQAGFAHDKEMAGINFANQKAMAQYKASLEKGNEKEAERYRKAFLDNQAKEYMENGMNFQEAYRHADKAFETYSAGGKYDPFTKGSDMDVISGMGKTNGQSQGRSGKKESWLERAFGNSINKKIEMKRILEEDQKRLAQNKDYKGGR